VFAISKYKVEVKELGRDKVCKSVVVEKIDYDALYEIVKPHLLSLNIWFSVQEDEWGNVYAGFHAVGKITFRKL
jgi:hypothetical protein